MCVYTVITNEMNYLKEPGFCGLEGFYETTGLWCVCVCVRERVGVCVCVHVCKTAPSPMN